MIGPVLSVKFFHTAAGNEPVRDFLRDLLPEERKIIGTDIKEVQFGWPLGMPLVRKMEKDLWEVRSHLERRIASLLKAATETGCDNLLILTWDIEANETAADKKTISYLPLWKWLMEEGGKS